jgi:adenylate cyclase
VAAYGRPAHREGPLSNAGVEFSSEAEATAFPPPAWFGREVTGEPGWANAALARRGLPS